MTYRAPLYSVRIKEFRLYIIQRFFFIMAMRMIATVVGWKMYEITRNPLAIAFIGLSEAIPAISLALYSGHVVDKSDKRTLLFRTHSIIFSKFRSAYVHYPASYGIVAW